MQTSWINSEANFETVVEFEDYQTALTRMYGEERMSEVISLINGEANFHGLTETSMALEGIEPHLRLIESYKKLHSARAKLAE